jgi:mRNA interferase RelE/StbE
MWKVSLDDRAHKELKKLDKQIGQKILDYMQERIATSQNPRRFGKPLSYDKHGLWRYRGWRLSYHMPNFR